jgi:extracellular elastinolytic metalloproteinase
MRTFVVFAAATLFVFSSSIVFSQTPTLVAPKARIYVGAPTLSASSSTSRADAVANFLKGKGVSPAGVLSATSEYRSAASGLVHVRLEQAVNGLRVVNTFARATFNSEGALVRLSENLATSVASTRQASVDERQALRAAMAVVHPGANQDPAIVGRSRNKTLFAKTAFFHQSPTVEHVAIASANGATDSGMLVITWSENGNRLHHTLVSGNGEVVSVESRTNTENTYNVFRYNPTVSAQQVTAGGANWLFAGPQNSIDIAGNNVNAYLDARSNNRPDRGGIVVNSGDFLTQVDLTQTPSTSSNREAAVQNLFYLNNFIHDALNGYGFTEGAGNFQETNFTGQGLGSDSVFAEAQDGGGTDNANFATPADGTNPRMQMYLWTGKGTYQVAVSSPITVVYRAQGAAFGGKLDSTGVSGDVVLANDGTGTTSDGCEAITNVSGKIALMDRGTCGFVVKVANAQAGGAIAAVVANNLGDSIITMGGTDHSIRIGAVFIGKSDGAALRGLASPVAAARLTDPAPLQRDGDLDADIVFHEYGHGLTWRMIGGMSGPIAGALGEGMSDVLAIVMNDRDGVNDDVLGEYAFDDPLGIRRFPYTNYPLTYGSIKTDGEVHNDGEIYGAIGWRLLQNFKGAGLTRDDLLTTLVDGMNYTDPTPAYENMRDGILASIAARPSAASQECLVWDSFAHYGVGVNAQGVVTSTHKSTTVTVKEDFTRPAQCP